MSEKHHFREIKVFCLIPKPKSIKLEQQRIDDFRGEVKNEK